MAHYLSPFYRNDIDNACCTIDILPDPVCTFLSGCPQLPDILEIIVQKLLMYCAHACLDFPFLSYLSHSRKINIIYSLIKRT